MPMSGKSLKVRWGKFPSAHFISWKKKLRRLEAQGCTTRHCVFVFLFFSRAEMGAHYSSNYPRARSLCQWPKDPLALPSVGAIVSVEQHQNLVSKWSTQNHVNYPLWRRCLTYCRADVQLILVGNRYFLLRRNPFISDNKEEHLLLKRYQK